MRRFLGVSLVACALSGAMWADVARRGTEFRVNTYTTGNQGDPSVASDAKGDFVVVWTSYGQDGWGQGVFGRRFDRDGVPLGDAFQVNTHTPDNQDVPSVAADAAGNFVVVWQTWYQDGSLSGIFGRLYDDKGAPRGPEFQVNHHTAGYQEGPMVASDPDGGFVVVWHSLDQDGSGWGGFGRRFDRSGTPAGADFQINTHTTGAQIPTGVATDPNGNCVVVWTSDGQDGSTTGIFGRRFDDTGAPLGPEFQVNSHTTSYQQSASVASDANGNFVVAWQSWDQDGSYAGIFGRRFDSAGAPASPEFPVNAFTGNHQSSPSVASDAEGNFVVTWDSYYQDDSSWGVYGRRFEAGGGAAGDEFQVHTHTTSTQNGASVASDAYGSFVATWSSSDQDGSGSGIFGQRFVGRLPSLFNPHAGETVDCSDPRVFRPTLAWDDDGYDRFRVHIGWDPGFGTGGQVTSGDTLLRTTSWIPPAKKWRKACASALAVNPGSPKLYVKVFGVDSDLPKSASTRKVYSETVQVNVQP